MLKLPPNVRRHLKPRSRLARRDLCLFTCLRAVFFACLFDGTLSQLGLAPECRTVCIGSAGSGCKSRNLPEARPRWHELACCRVRGHSPRCRSVAVETSELEVPVSNMRGAQLIVCLGCLLGGL